jgi:hypothetical protein
MMTYLLKQGTEIINKTKADNFEDALEYFSKIKNLPKNKILELFKIEKE